MTKKLTGRARFTLTKPFVEDPKVFERYQPLAERLLCLAESTDLITDLQREIVREKLCGNKEKRIAKDHEIALITAATYAGSAIKTLASLNPQLVSDVKKVQHEKYTKEVWAEKKKEYNARFNQRHPDLRYLYTKRYAQNHPERRKETVANYRAKLGETYQQYLQQYYAKNKKRINARLRRYKRQKSRDTREGKRMVKTLKFSSSLLDVQAALLGLGSRPLYNSFEAILPFIRHKVDFVKSEAIWALGNRQDREAVPYLSNLARETTDSLILIKILKALGNINTWPSIAVVRRYLSHKDSMVSTVANRIVDEFDKKERRALRRLGKPCSVRLSRRRIHLTSNLIN